ncbi:lipopolysaccharide kinase InaA family protein [Pseudomonas sp. JS3066]|uniref:lipopolysaccharide kinase InaA family protein n=1 Tax=unclassified Pseudomonas TaxID=196821 RepID=UPI00129E5769|nr:MULTISPECIES: lipopolysaccharide kinase InaA family protein [unclassified Pseudomonas]MDH4655131.1 lipopolysaccharide kinase [Pseudomonas sp. BN606]MRK20354.1 lipopolysaccharide kinase [Pseudomonas sp. JG-B]WVK92689.1 lipopolysaccharide kinase InaA family protein [Pseudomonas sp. JS3066]
MSDFIAAADREILARHGLDSFDSLWALRLEAVDAPNTGRGGWSSVFRLDLGDAAYYLKRQSNFLSRSVLRPFGEPTFAREFRNIRRYQDLGVPALQAAFFGTRQIDGERRAILVSRALDGWRELASYLELWGGMAAVQRATLLAAVAILARRLHSAGQVHGCFYPKHVFLRETQDGFEACLIDLEKTRPLLLGRRDRVKDLEALVRRADAWGEAEVRELLAGYLERPRDSAEVSDWLARLARRRRNKEREQ